MMGRFQDPAFLMLIALGLACLAIWFRSKRHLHLRFSSVKNLQAASNQGRGYLLKMPLVLRFAVLVFIALALARPQSPKGMADIKSEGVDILLVLDTSGSMRALDFTINQKRVMRLDVVKKVVSEFIEKRRFDRLGMVVFGEDALTQVPLTLDHAMVLSLLSEVRIGMAGDATAIGSAIAIGTKRLKNLTSKSKIMVLLTDGRSNAGSLSPENASQLAKAFGIKIYTIGVGTKGKAPFIVDGLFGKQTVYQEVDIDEDALQKVAEVTGGRYFRATDTESLKGVYDEIDRLEKNEIKTKDLVEYEEKFPLFALLGLLVLIGEWILSETRLRALPI